MLQPSPVDLSTIFAVKQYLSADGTVSDLSTTDDDTIQRMLTAISRIIMRRTGNYSGPWQTTLQNPWVQPQTYTDVYSGGSTVEFYTRVWPVQTIQGLTIQNVQIPASTGFQQYGYQISDDGRRIVLMGGATTSGFFIPNFYTVRGNCGGRGWPRFLRGTRNITLEYTGGVVPQQITGELQTIPATGPYTVGVNTTPWLSDVSVQYFIGGATLTRVMISPNAGEYFIQAPGVYLFNVADAGAQILMSYNASGCPEDLVWAAIDTVAYNYKKKGRLGLKTEQLAGTGGGMSTYTDLEIPPEALGTILDYKRDDVYPL